MKNVLATLPPSQSSIQQFLFSNLGSHRYKKKDRQTDRPCPWAMCKNLVLKLPINPDALRKMGSNPNETKL